MLALFFLRLGLVFFCKFVNGLTSFYPELFDGDGSGGSASNLQYNFSKKWKSYATIVELANGDITKIDEVVKEPLEKCLLLLSYKADKGTLEKMMHDAVMAASK